jgi:hypothetical protein
MLYGRLMTGLGISLVEARRMTLPEAMRLFVYWRTNPPVHELLAVLAQVYTTWEPPRSVEDKQREGAMTPADFFAHFQRTGGKVEGLSAMPGM